MNRIEGKYALVTGGTQGLGAAIIRQFARAGASGIISCGRNRERGQRVAESTAEETGCPVHFVRTELSEITDCRAAIAAADDAFSRLDIVVNAAALTERGTILDTDPELFDRMFAVNVRAPFFLIQDAVRLMIRDGVEGAIVNIGSISARAGQPFISAYCASKGALATLTANTAFAVLRNRIRCNQLNIGWMASDGEDRIQREFHDAGDGWQEKAGAGLPFGRLVDPAEIARAVAYLASPDSGLMTGSIINFDQSVWGASAFAPPSPETALTL